VNKILLIIIILIVAIGAFMFMGKKATAPTVTQPTNQPTVAQTNNSVATVTLTASGFEPKDITIKAGATVVWTNKSGEPATINSANHPTHLLYPFLNLGEFADGASLQVVVEKAGSYSYHNHLNPSETGTITAQ
jgi:plastocyanin